MNWTGHVRYLRLHAVVSGRWEHSRNIHSDKVERNSLSFDSSQLLVREIVIYHSAKNHIIKSVDPKRREDEEDKRDLRDRRVERRLYAGDSGHN